MSGVDREKSEAEAAVPPRPRGPQRALGDHFRHLGALGHELSRPRQSLGGGARHHEGFRPQQHLTGLHPVGLRLALRDHEPAERLVVDRFGTKLTMSIAAGLWSVASLLTGFATSVRAVCRTAHRARRHRGAALSGRAQGHQRLVPRQGEGARHHVYIAGTQIGLAASPADLDCPHARLRLAGDVHHRQRFRHAGRDRLAAGLPRTGAAPLGQPGELGYIRNGQIGRAAAEAKGKASAREWASLFSYRTVWTMIIASFCSHYTYWLYITWLPTYLSKAQQFHAVDGGLYRGPAVHRQHGGHGAGRPDLRCPGGARHGAVQPPGAW